MRCLFIALAMLTVVQGTSLGQRLSYEPFKSAEPGQRIGAFPPPKETTEEVMASLTFVAETFGSGIPDGSALEWLDVDGDLDIDYISFTLSSGVVSLFENINQTFAKVESSGLNMLVKAYYVTDVNRDNRIDFVFIENRSIKVAINNGDKTFTTEDTGIVLEWDGAQPLYCFDYDGDSDLDLITRPTSAFYAFIPSQRYGSNSAFPYPTDFSYLSFANLDNYGVVDFFLTIGSTGYTVQSSGISGGTIYSILQSTSNFINAAHPRILWADIDLDGDLDMFGLTSTGWRVFVNSYKQNGLPQLVQGPTLSSSTRAAATGDLNSDGKPDFVVYSGPLVGGNILVYLNTTTASGIQFTLDQTITGATHSQLYLVDVDGQSGVDIVSNFTLLKNTLGTLSPPPTVPVGLTGSWFANQLRLYWQPAGNGLTYRYEVYKDGDLFFTSESADNGSLFLYQRIPIILAPPVYLQPVPEGQYSFRVQSVDASNRGSAFSTIKEIEINVPVGLDVSPNFSIYPNPAIDRLSIMLSSSGRVIIRDNLSRLIVKQEVDINASRTVDLSVVDWAAGMYSVQFESGGKVLIQKFVVGR